NPASTSTGITSSANPSTPAQSVTFTAQVLDSSGNGGTPTGTVTFNNGSTALGTQTLSGSPDQAVLVTSALTLGSHVITAVYNSDGNFATSTSAALTQKVQYLTTTAVTSSLNPSRYGQAATFSATVAPTIAGLPIPTGTVTFKNGATSLGSATLS